MRWIYVVHYGDIISDMKRLGYLEAKLTSLFWSSLFGNGRVHEPKCCAVLW